MVIFGLSLTKDGKAIMITSNDFVKLKEQVENERRLISEAKGRYQEVLKRLLMETGTKSLKDAKCKHKTTLRRFLKSKVVLEKKEHAFLSRYKDRLDASWIE